MTDLSQAQLLIDQLLAACSAGLAAGYPLGLLLALAGLVAGFTHCAAHCGGLLLAQAEAGGGALAALHAGRLSAYAALGAASAGLSRLVLAGPLEEALGAALLLVAGTLFIAEGLLRLPVMATLGFADLRLTSGRLMPRTQFFAGALFGLLPCGMTIAALLAASTAPSALDGAVAMAGFGLGTLPGLLVVSGAGRIAAQRWPQALRQLSTAALLCSGAFLFILATTVIA